MTVATGTLYLILKRHKDDDNIETYRVEFAEGPTRKHSPLTEKGRSHEDQLTGEWQEF